jgi:hypothetical protein
MRRNPSRVRLARGQRPLIELIRIDKAHDVRRLCICVVCNGLGDRRIMIAHSSAWYHGRCFATALGKRALLALPRKETNRLTLGDLGNALMKALLGARV